ncbi:MAG: PfkB family carbohydrate kinase [Chloroflexota bacterium]
MKIVSVGEATVDYYPHIDQLLVGGISLNFAVQAKRAGAEQVSLVSRVGSDPHAQLIRERLKTEGIDQTHLHTVDGQTAECTIVIKENGERYFPPNSYHQHVLADYCPSAADLSFIRAHEIVAARFDISYTRAAFDLVMLDPEFKGKKVADFGDWFDYRGRHPEIFPYLNRVDLAFISGDQETIRTFRPLSLGIKALIVVTLGKDGSVALLNGQLVEQPAAPASKIVDTTGCGDAFQATFTVNFFKTLDLQLALRAASEQAANTLMHVGAI